MDNHEAQSFTPVSAGETDASSRFFADLNSAMFTPADEARLVQPITDAILSGNFSSLKGQCEEALSKDEQLYASGLVSIVNEQLTARNSTYSLRDLVDYPTNRPGWRASDFELDENVNGETRRVNKFNVDWKMVSGPKTPDE